jgi:RNA polymerase sigma-70 factor, ECF subfamily
MLLLRSALAAVPNHGACCYAPSVRPALRNGSPPVADARLVAAIAQGDDDRAAAEDELCRRYQRRIYLYGLKHLRDTAAAADLVQDVLTTVVQKARAGEIREPEKFGSFVLGTCRMVSTNRVRGEARRRKILAQYGDPRELPRGYAHETEPPPRGDLERVAGCLGALRDRERAVLLLSFYAELDAAAIGTELGLSAGNVRVVRHRAIEQLQGCMNAGAPEDA